MDDNVEGKIFAFGSYRLGVSSIGSDIDCVCVCPVFIEREEFFTLFSKRLKDEPDVSNVNVVYATVPLIKFEFCSIEIDLLFALYTSVRLPETLDLTSDDILRRFDPGVKNHDFFYIFILVLKQLL
jgi:poly(A) polymerase